MFHSNLVDSPFHRVVFLSTIQKSACLAIIGSGVEENRNGSEPISACLASPHGICNGEMNGQPVLFIADSNSSTIRVVSLRDGHLTTLIGGDTDPTVGPSEDQTMLSFCFSSFRTRISPPSVIWMESDPRLNYNIQSVLLFITHRPDCSSRIHSTINWNMWTWRVWFVRATLWQISIRKSNVGKRILPNSTNPVVSQSSIISCSLLTRIILTSNASTWIGTPLFE